MAISTEKLPSEIWTIGHSTRSIENFIEILTSFKIELLADVRSLPGSNRYPHFNKENMERSLKEYSIGYIHIPLLGGRRRVIKDSKNTSWKNKSFRGYADYMETGQFSQGIAELLHLAGDKRTAIMCAEALWWRCHRSMISDYLKSIGIIVHHILDVSKSEEHRYTSPSKIGDGGLTYHE